jgi:hypothetical protein
MMNAHHYFFFTTGFLLGLGRALAGAVLSFLTLRPDLEA